MVFPFYIYDNEDVNDAAGLYLNYLELKDHIFLPIFIKKIDNQAIVKAREIFPYKVIITIKSNQPAKNLGIINCLTWNFFLKGSNSKA